MNKISFNFPLLTFNLALLVLLCITSCGVYKPYKSSYVEPKDSVPHWKQVFTDPCLQALIDSTLTHNSDVKLARLNIQQAQVAYKASKLAYLPTFAFEPNAGYYKFGREYNALSGWSYSLGISASWQLDVFGATITNTKRQSKASKEYMEYYKQAVDCQLISSMAQLYYQLLSQEKQLKIQEDMLGLYEKTYDASKSLFQAGQYTIAAVDESKAQLEALKASIIELKYDVEQTKKGICQLMDVKPYAFKYGTMDNVPVPALATNGIPANMLAGRPDLRAAEKQIEIAFYDVQISKGAFYPGINITANGGWMYPQLWFANVLGGLTQPIFQGGKLTAKLKTAKLQQEIAVTNFERKMLDAYYDVVYDLDKIKLASDKKAHLQEQVKSLKGSVDANQELMNNGQATYLEVLTSMRNYLTARTSEVANESSTAQALVALYGAIGGR